MSGTRAPYTAVIIRDSGRSSIPETQVIDREAPAYWIPAFAGLTTGESGAHQKARHCGPVAFSGSCDDAAVPLICPDASSICPKCISAGDCLLLCMGSCSIF